MSHNEGKWEVVGKSKNAKPKVKKDANGVANGVTTVLQRKFHHEKLNYC